MKGPEEVSALAHQRIFYRRMKALREWELRVDAIYAEYPEIEAMDKRTFDAGAEHAKSVLEGKDAYLAAKARFEAAQQERKALIARLGIDPDYNKPRFICEICGDQGNMPDTGLPCSCKQRLIEALTPTGWDEENSGAPAVTFRDLTIDVFTDAEQRERSMKLYQTALRYAQNFDRIMPEARFLFIHGPQGTGKTHMSAAIANQVEAKGRSVLFVHAAKMQEAMAENYMQQNAFRPDPDRLMAARYRTQHLRKVELLIIDDLGAEARNKQVYGEIVALIDHRQKKNLHTIITSNLSRTEVAESYDERLASRLGLYVDLTMTGKDLRVEGRRSAQ